MTRPATTTIRLGPEDRKLLDRIRYHDGERLALAGPCSQSAVFRRLLREESERLEKAELERATGRREGVR